MIATWLRAPGSVPSTPIPGVWWLFLASIGILCTWNKCEQNTHTCKTEACKYFFLKKRKKMMMNLISRRHKIGVVILPQIEIIIKCCLQEGHIESPAPSFLQFEWLNVSVFFKLAYVVMRANVIIGLVFRTFQNWWMKVYKIAIIPFNANKFVIKVQDWIYSTQET